MGKLVGTALVTGSRGFIGRYLTARLRKLCPIIEWNSDVRTIGACKEKVDTVYHLAAVTDRQAFVENAREAFDVNVCGTLAVLNYCKKVGALCVMTSTSGVYKGSEDGGKLSEKAEINPGDYYSLSKWLAEGLCRREAVDWHVKSVILRLFNVFGFGQDSSFLIPYVINCLCTGKQIRLRMPDAKRDFVYVRDVVEALVKAGQLGNVDSETFNIGSGVSTKVVELIRLAEEVFEKTVVLDSAKPGDDEKASVIADINMAKKHLDWENQFDLRTGLEAVKREMEKT